MVVVLDHPPEEVDAAVAARDHCLRPERGGLQRRRQSNDLEHRSWLEGNRSGMVHPRFQVVSRLYGLIGVEGGVASNRQDLSGLGVDDNHASGFAFAVDDGFGELSLRHVLQPFVDGQNDVLAGEGLLADL
jgi:hypothetical protein